MTQSRSTLVDSENPGFYHLFNRCVRRAWLCGLDPLTERSYEHRRAWVEERITSLSRIFAVEVFSYVVMSNHYHIVVRLDPKAPQGWSDETVARRWVSLSTAKGEPHTDERIRLLLGDQSRLKECRDRLGSLSWYMRYINEPVARRANREDECTGRFWEGRFVSIALLDDDAVISGMVYVDLNPVRAGISKDPIDSEFTSVRKRARANSKCKSLGALVSGLVGAHFELPITINRYLELVKWTAQRTTQDPSCSTTDDWCIAVNAHARRNRRAFGSRENLYALAHRLGQQWVKGCGQAVRRSLLWQAQ